MKLVTLISCLVIYSLSYGNISPTSNFQFDNKVNIYLDSIIKYKQAYPKKALEFGLIQKKI